MGRMAGQGRPNGRGPPASGYAARVDGERCCFDDLAGGWARSARRKGLTGVSSSLLGAVEEAGVADRSVLELGCGVGTLAIEAVRRGASRAFGYDLSGRAILEARRLAVERGVGERTTFEVGDGARVRLPNADVVVLNRVFCCYPDVSALLERSLDAAGSVYAFTIPPSTGFAGRVARAETDLGNRLRRLRPAKFGSYRAFIHDIGPMDERVRAAGFEPLRRERRALVWDLAVYAR